MTFFKSISSSIESFLTQHIDLKCLKLRFCYVFVVRDATTKIEEKTAKKYALFKEHADITPIGEFNWKLFNLSELGNIRVEGVTIDLNRQISFGPIVYFVT